MGLFALFWKKKERKPIVKVVTSSVFNSKAIKPDNTPLHVKRGWTKKGNMYQGYYRTIYGAWRGGIEKRGDKFKVLIYKPPIKQIKRHPRWPCFHEERGGKWRIELAINPRDGDVGAIIFYVERLIIESFRK